MRNTRYLLCLFAALMFMARPTVADPSAAEQIKGIIDTALQHPYQAHGVQGVLVQSMDTGKVIYDHNGDMMLIPASNMKLIAASAAFEMISPDYKMFTSLYSTAEPKNGVIKGDLVLEGEGDPILRVEHLQQMVDQLKTMGVKRIKGNIVGDDTWFDTQHLGPGWAWDDEQYFDCSQPNALNVNENYIDVYARPGKKVGDPAVVEIRPAASCITIENHAVTTPAGTQYTAWATRVHETNTIQVFGNVPLGYSRSDDGIKQTGLEIQSDTTPYYKGMNPIAKLSIDEPTIFVCTIFKELCEKSGIKISGKAVRGVKPENAILLSAHDSPPLSEIIRVCLKPSDNFMSECMLKMLGKVLKGEGSYSAGKAAEREWLASIGADMGQIYIADSSGQSRCDLITPHNLVVLLTHMYHTKYYDALANSLPIAGVDSHLKNRMLGTPAVGNVKAKTGYLERQCSLSGYVKTLAGENMAVSVIQNNHLCSLDEAYVLQDTIFSAVSEITTRTDAAN